jgi:hypothetical protein
VCKNQAEPDDSGLPVDISRSWEAALRLDIHAVRLKQIAPAPAAPESRHTGHYPDYRRICSPRRGKRQVFSEKLSLNRVLSGTAKPVCTGFRELFHESGLTLILYASGGRGAAPDSGSGNDSPCNPSYAETYIQS